jgi:hypothetical protein
MIHSEVIALDEHSSSVRGHTIRHGGPIEVWVKRLADRSYAVGLLKADGGSMPVRIGIREIGVTGCATVRDLWATKDLGRFIGSFSEKVPKDGVAMLKITPRL